MDYREVKMNLFDAPSNYKLVHCISMDFALGAGIAKEFDKRYDMKHKLMVKYGDFTKTHICGKDKGYCFMIDNVYNLVTKDKYYNKPTYENLENALLSMKLQMLKNNCHPEGYDYIAMPLIGCGLDKLDWGEVRTLIFKVFGDMENLIILVCRL